MDTFMEDHMDDFMDDSMKDFLENWMKNFRGDVLEDFPEDFLPNNPSTDPTQFLGAIVLVVLSIIWWLLSASECTPAVDQKDDYPIVGEVESYQLLWPFNGIFQRLHWFANGPQIIHNAYEDYPTSVYRLPCSDRTSFVLPPRCLKQVSTLPPSHANNSHATSDFFMGKWTTLSYDIFSHSNLNVVRKQFISRIRFQVNPVHNEAQFRLRDHFSNYSDWNELIIYPKVLQLVASMMARAMVGVELCRDPRWVSSVLGYSQSVFMSTVFLKLVPESFLPIAWALSPFTYQIYYYRRQIRLRAKSAIRQRMKVKRNDPTAWSAKMKGKDLTTLDFLVDAAFPETTQDDIAAGLIGIAFGATHTTSSHVTNCLLNLAADFDTWAPPLREEIFDAFGRSLDNITNAQISKMWKLDSFMKETQRFNPPSQLSVNRKTFKNIVLENGDLIPAGSHICLPGVPMSLSEEYFDDAQTFDGFRFERMRRSGPKNQNGLQFTSSYAGSLHFGHGRHMCPGRFMGSLVSKLIVIQLLRKYDMKLDGDGKRPQNMTFMDMDIPNPGVKIMFKDRSS